MEKGGDRRLLIAAFFEHQGAHTQQVPDVRELAALALLVDVRVERERQRVGEVVTERRGGIGLRAMGAHRPTITSAPRGRCVCGDQCASGCLGNTEIATSSPSCSTPAPTIRVREIVNAWPRP